MASDVIQPNEWEDYMYDVHITIASKGEMVELKPAQIQSILIEKDFDNPKQMLPILILSISKQESLHISINHETEFIISICSFIVQRNKKGEIKKRKNKRNVLRDIFGVMVTDTTPGGDNLAEIYQKDAKIKKNEVTPTDLTKQTTYTLYRKKDLISSKHIFNNVVANINMTQAIATLLSQAGVEKPLMTNLDNVSLIEEVLFLPIGLIAQLNYLKNYYGWHKEDTLIFMDYDCMYLIRMNGKCTAWRQGELKNISFYINSSSRGDNLNGGMIQRGNGLYINVGRDNYNCEDKTGVVEQTIGTNTIMINENNASSSMVSGATTATVSSKGSTTIRTTSGHNPYIENWMKCRSEENTRVVTLTCNNIDYSLLTPNKEYNIVAGKAKIVNHVKGTYRLSKVTTTFTKNGNDFMQKSNLTLKKSIG